jgi:hypothetical protein
MALNRVWMPSPNYSSRGGASVRLVVIHTAEGARTIESLGGYFQGDVGASSHVGADDKPNTVGEYVRRGDKSWTQAEFNPQAVSLELCGFASWSRDEWTTSHGTMLENCARWIAEECAHFGLPITKLSASEAQGGGRGVCQHVDLGSRGGGHHDCGSGFPIDEVLDMARGGASAAPSTREGDMVASVVADNGTLHVFQAKGRDLLYTYQTKNSSSWSGGAAGKQIAGFAKFASAPKDIVGVTADVAANGNLHVFVDCDDGEVYYTWQAKGATSWAGGAPGKAIAGLARFS